MFKNKEKMSSILVLVAADDDKPLTEKHLEMAKSCFDTNFLLEKWLSPQKAVELYFESMPETVERAKLEGLFAVDRIDTFVVADDQRRKKKLLVSDMDNTMVIGETLDDLAEACGLKDKIAAITDRAMRGDFDFHRALRIRVEMLKGLGESALQETCERIQYMKGAETLVQTMRANGAKCVLVSGGFTSFTEPVAARLGFHENHGNVLDIEGGALTGKVCDPILDHQSKLELLQYYSSVYEIDPRDTMAVGDGANDLTMISSAGLGVGYHPKPYLRERADNSVLYGDLTALLYVQGYSTF